MHVGTPPRVAQRIALSITIAHLAVHCTAQKVLNWCSLIRDGTHRTLYSMPSYGVNRAIGPEITRRANWAQNPLVFAIEP